MVKMVGMVKKVEWFLIIAVFVLALALRFYKLGQIPPSLDWDEVSLAYNAQSLLQTGKDEFGHSWPLSIQSFNDYKPPVYTYLLIPVLKIFGKTEFAVRFPSALAGVLTVLITYFLVKELFYHSKHFNHSAIPLLSSFLLAISPWHLQFSRIAFEANAGLFFFIAGMWLLIRALHHNSGWALFFSTLLMSMALMSYHSLRVVLPLMVIAILVIYRKEILSLVRPGLYWIPLILSAFLTILTILTISYTVFFQKVGQSRFEKTSFLTIDNLLTVNRDRLEKYGKNPVDKIVNIKYFVYAKQYIKGYLDHFDLRFWFLDSDRIDRHRTPDVGLIYWWELPFLFMGLMSLIGPMSPLASKEKTVLFIWMMLAPTASAMTGGTPSAVRSLVFLPTFQIFIALGIVKTIRSINIMSVKQKNVFSLLLTAYCLLLTVEISHYFHQYYIHSSLEYASSWQYGYKQMVKNVMEEKDNYEKILITTSYDQPYIYFLWYGNYDPKTWINDGEFNKRFDKFEFKKIDRLEMSSPENTLFVGTPMEMPSGNLKWRIDYPTGQAAFLATEK